MTITEFKKYPWCYRIEALYNGHWYIVASVNFPEALLGLAEHHEDEDLLWVRCENVPEIRKGGASC